MQTLTTRLLSLAILVAALSGQMLPAQGTKAGPKDAKPAAAETPVASEVDAGDYVKTTTGLVFPGKIVEDTPEQVVVLTKTGTVPIPRAIIKEVHKAGVDTRPASEKISAATIPEGQEAAFAEKAKALAGEHKYTEAAALCKALMEDGPTRALSEAQRDGVGRVASLAFFELKDWPASAQGLKYSARTVKEEVHRDRLLAMAEALEANQPPTIGEQAAGNFDEAMSLAMKWKADRIFKDALEYALNVKDFNRKEAVDRAIQGASIRLAKAEAYVPGTSVMRWPEICRALVTSMTGMVERAITKCTHARTEMTRLFWQRAASVNIGLEWNAKTTVYLGLRQAAVDCLSLVVAIDAQHPLKAAYKDEEYKQFGEQLKKLDSELSGLQFYDADAQDPSGRVIRSKGKRIELVKFGN